MKTINNEIYKKIYSQIYNDVYAIYYKTYDATSHNLDGRIRFDIKHKIQEEVGECSY